MEPDDVVGLHLFLASDLAAKVPSHMHPGGNLANAARCLLCCLFTSGILVIHRIVGRVRVQVRVAAHA